MIVTVKVNPTTFEMKMKFLKGSYPNIATVVADLVPVKEEFKGKFLEYTFDVTEQQLEMMK